MKHPGYYERPGLLLGRLSQSASWVIFEVTGLCTPLRCRWAHPHSGPSGNSFIRPSEWPHSSPSPPLVTLRLCRGPRTNFSLFPRPSDLPRSHPPSVMLGLLFQCMQWWWWWWCCAASGGARPRCWEPSRAAAEVVAAARAERSCRIYCRPPGEIFHKMGQRGAKRRRPGRLLIPSREQTLEVDRPIRSKSVLC